MSCIHEKTNDKFKTFMKDNLKKSEENVHVGSYNILFGKYKNEKSFEEIYRDDKPYVAYLIDTLDYDRNKFFLDYWMELICDSDEVIEKKKQTRTRKKKEVVKEKVEEEEQ